jgi:putative FmdB family regulatory protein
MPTYDYHCSKCGQDFEHSQSMTKVPLTNCLDPACGGKGTMKRLIGSGAGFIFKGSGFYATDYKGAGKQGTPKTESKPAAPRGDSCAGASSGTESPAPKPASPSSADCTDRK